MRGRSIIEAISLFVAITAAQYLIPGIYQLTRWESRVLGESYFLGLITLATPLMVTVVTKKSLEDYGLIVRDWRVSFGRGLTGYFYLLLPNLTLFVMTVPSLEVTSLFVSLAVSVVTWIAMLLTLMHLSRGGGPHTRRNLITVIILLGAPLIFTVLYGSFNIRLASIVVWEIVFGGVANEVLYRGFMQGRVNEEYGRPWKLMSVSYGPGLVVSSALYGLAGAMSGLNPLRGQFALSIPVGIHGIALGLFLGFLREAAGDIGAGSVASGLSGAIGRLLMRAVS